MAMRMLKQTLVFLSLLLILLDVIVAAKEEEECSPQDDTCNTTTTTTTNKNHRIVVPDDCRLVYYNNHHQDDESFSSSLSSSWGVYSLTSRSKATSVFGNFGDVVIQWTGPLPRNSPMNWLEYSWPGQETGGQFESSSGEVHSIVPGLGMMTHATADVVGKSKPNLLPFVPRVDEGGLTRFDSPGAGAITHYHNFTWFVSHYVDAGDELILSKSLREAKRETTPSKLPPPPPSLEALRQRGYCLDNLRPKKSRVKQAGRGAYATRDMAKGAVVAPVPVLILPKNNNDDDAIIPVEKQLLRNYCLGHKDSSILLYPFGPFVNLINHYTTPNVKFVWSQSSQPYLESSSPLLLSTEEENNPPPLLLLELVAARPIQQGEELYLDYGRDWEDAWWNHTKRFEPTNNNNDDGMSMMYTPSYVMDDAVRLLRTQQEQKTNPYPPNVETSCFYRYADRNEPSEVGHETTTTTTTVSSSNKNTNKSVQGFRWKLTKGLFDLKNLRPCQVLRRNEDSKGRSMYAVRILSNPPGVSLPPDEIIPKGDLHIVTGVPRSAVRFTDKAGTTDQHLPHAFRHEIGLDDNVFPKAWMDLLFLEKEQQEQPPPQEVKEY